MSFSALEWEGHAFSGAVPSSCKPKTNFSIEAPLVPDDVFEELYWEDGQLMYTIQPHQNQLRSSAPSAHVQGTRDHVYVGGSTASLENNINKSVEDKRASSRVGSSSSDMFDDDMIAWLQYPPDVDPHVEKAYSKQPVVSYLPSLLLEKSDRAPYRGYTLMEAIHTERHVMRNENSSQQGGLACTQAAVCTATHDQPFGTSFQSPTFAFPNPGSASDTQSPTPILVPNVAALMPHSDRYTPARNSLQSLSRLAGEWEPDAGVPSLQAVIDGDKHIHQPIAGICACADSSLESTVTGISLQGPSVAVDSHVVHCVDAMSLTLHQVHEPVPIKKPGEIACTDASGALHSKGTCCTDGVHIKSFSKGNRIHRGYNSVKRKGKDSDNLESRTEDIVNQPQGFLTKRSRAAEIHNKSERKRRERINEKLKTLQELIPNANKTDKASLLEQAIEYLKALQAQIMVMSYTTGITIPPMLISNSMLYPYVPSHTGMGFGAGLVKNSNANSVGVVRPANSPIRKTSSLKPLVPLPTLPSPARLVGTRNDLSNHMIGYNVNYFPMANIGLVSPPYQLHTHTMSIHHKTPSFP